MGVSSGAMGVSSGPTVRALAALSNFQRPMCREYNLRFCFGNSITAQEEFRSGKNTNITPRGVSRVTPSVTPSLNPSLTPSHGVRGALSASRSSVLSVSSLVLQLRPSTCTCTTTTTTTPVTSHKSPLPPILLREGRRPGL